MPSPILKVCGLTRRQDVEACDRAGVDLTGFIFAPGSPRRVEPQFVARLPRGRAKRVGVFAGLETAMIQRIADQSGLDLLQLHGGESPQSCAELGPERVIKVFWPQAMDREELKREMERFAPVCAWFLFDAGSSGGGSGRRLALESLADLSPSRPWLLAGGLTVEMLPEVLACAPDGVDMNSGLEDGPGVKNHALIARAAEALRAPHIETK